jgi:GT2 family glycosyltransferase
VSKATPFFSVVIPTCRRPETLAHCLERLAPGAQTLSADRYEILVTDDAGTGPDSVEALVHRSFPNVSWAAGPGRGPAANRNAGAARARGEWLVFTDDDCLPSAGWLEAFAEAIASGGETRHVYEGRTTCEAGLRSALDHAPVNLTGGVLWSCNVCIRRSVFTTLGGFDEDYPLAHMEDINLRERLVRADYPYFFVEEATIDHPPKRFHWRTAFGPYAESEVLHWYKQGNPGPYTTQLLLRICRYRLAWMGEAARRSPGSLLSVVAISVRELAYVLPRLRGWDRKYRALYGQS